MSPQRFLPPVDDAVLVSLQEIVGPEAMGRVIDVMLETCPPLCAAVEQASALGDAAALRAAAHQLKGSTGSLGATRLPVMCDQVEAYARAGDLAAAKSLAAWIRSEYQQVHDHMARFRAHGAASPVSGAA